MSNPEICPKCNMLLFVCKCSELQAAQAEIDRLRGEVEQKDTFLKTINELREKQALQLAAARRVIEAAKALKAAKEEEEANLSHVTATQLALAMDKVAEAVAALAPSAAPRGEAGGGGGGC